jgi:hypothetical protein
VVNVTAAEPGVLRKLDRAARRGTADIDQNVDPSRMREICTSVRWGWRFWMVALLKCRAVVNWPQKPGRPVFSQEGNDLLLAKSKWCCRCNFTFKPCNWSAKLIHYHQSGKHVEMR